jgi:hypothetical protein
MCPVSNKMFASFRSISVLPDERVELVLLRGVDHEAASFCLNPAYSAAEPGD